MIKNEILVIIGSSAIRISLKQENLLSTFKMQVVSYNSIFAVHDEAFKKAMSTWLGLVLWGH